MKSDLVLTLQKPIHNAMTKFKQEEREKIRKGELLGDIERLALSITSKEDIKKGIIEISKKHKPLLDKIGATLTAEVSEYLLEKHFDWLNKRREREEQELGILKNPNLLNLLVKEVQKKVTGETKTIHTLHIFKNGELVINCQAASFNLGLFDESGIGKDFVLKHTLGIYPKENRLHKSKFTPEVLAYWHNSYNEPEWTWDGKSLHLEEISGAVLNSDTFVGFSSTRDYEGEVVSKQKVIPIKTNGKPVMFISTASKDLRKDHFRRYPIIMLDESIIQTEAIMDKQAEAKERGYSLEYNSEITQALRHLKRGRVRIPYARKFTEALKKKVKMHLIFRTNHNRFLDLITASTMLYQYQRELDSEGYYIATEQDYNNAEVAMEKISQSASTIPLIKNKKKLIEIIKGLGGGFHTVKDIEPKATFLAKPTLYKYLRELADDEFLICDKLEEEDSRGRPYYPLAYNISDEFKQIKFPTFEEIKAINLKTVNSINSVKTVKTVKTIVHKESNEEIKQEEIPLQTKRSPTELTVLTDLKDSQYIKGSKLEIQKEKIK